MAVLLLHRPDSATGRNSCRHGSGKLPPYLAGREAEQALAREHLEILADGEAPASDAIPDGPGGTD